VAEVTKAGARHHTNEALKEREKARPCGPRLAQDESMTALCGNDVHQNAGNTLLTHAPLFSLNLVPTIFPLHVVVSLKAVFPPTFFPLNALFGTGLGGWNGDGSQLLRTIGETG
jgi:hypothetical protein